jgi:hypothetical protein
VLHPKTLAEVLDSILAIGSAADAVEAAGKLVVQLQLRLAAVAERVALVCPAAAAATATCSVSTFVAPIIKNSSCAETGSGSSSSKPKSQQQQQQQHLDSNHPKQQDHTQQQQQQQHRLWTKPPRVLSLEGLNPLVLGGQWLPDVKAAAGAVDASGQQPGEHPARITWQQVGLLVT